MSVKRRKGSPYWWYDLTIKGHRIRGSTETRDRKTAEIIEAKIRSDILLEQHIGKKPQYTLDQAFGRYWYDHASHISSAYNIDYQSQNILRGLGKNLPLSALSDDRVSQYISKRRAAVSNSSVNRELTLLRSVLRMAANKWKWEVSMPDWSVHRLIEPDPIDRYLKRSEYERLMAELADHLKPMVDFSLLTGVRLSNCTGLDWSQIDMHGRQMNFRVKSKKEGGKVHSLPITDPLLVLLANQGPKDEGPVFTFRGRPIKSPKKGFRRACERAGIKNLRWHDLRHTMATWAIQSGVPLDAVQDVLGHASIETTRRYAHRQDEAKLKAMEAAASQIGHNPTLPYKQLVEE